MELCDISYVDDDLFITYAPTAGEAERKLRVMAECVHSVFYAHGLTVNFAKGKTEGALLLVGPKAKEVRRRIAERGGIPITKADGDEAVLIVSEAYQHMGAISTPSLSMRQEIKHRANSAAGGLRTLRSHVLPAVAIPVGVKDRFIAALVDSRAFHAAAVWSYVEDRHLRPLDGPRMQAWRIARGLHNAGKAHEYRVTDAGMWSIIEKLPAHEVVRIARLRYLPRLVLHGPPLLHALLQAGAGRSRAWVQMAVDDFKLLQDAAPHGHPVKRLATLDVDPRPFLEYVRSGHWGWKAAVRAFAMNRIRHVRSWAEAVLSGGGNRLPEQSAADAEPPLSACIQCGATFANDNALASHCARKHGYTADLRKYVHSTHCLICLTEFWTYERCFHHLQRSSCGKAVGSCIDPISEELVEQHSAAERPMHTDNLRRGLPHRKAFIPAKRIIGPIIACKAKRAHCRCFVCRAP